MSELYDNAIPKERFTFWLNDISVLFSNAGYIKFIPTNDMTRVEQLNALSRFFMYMIIILFMLSESDEWMYIPIIGIIMCIILYNIYNNDEDGKRAELIRIKKLQNSSNEQSDEHSKSNEQFDHESTKIETGHIDSNGDIQMNTNTKEDDIKFSMDDIRLYTSKTCRRPTKDNPYMNPSIADFNKDNVPVACNADDADIEDNPVTKYDEDIYRDIEDVYDKKNSQRQFYTVAHNIPNDQDAFANWCYKTPLNCKTNQERCLRFDDPQFDYRL